MFEEASAARATSFRSRRRTRQGGRRVAVTISAKIESEIATRSRESAPLLERWGWRTGLDR